MATEARDRPPGDEGQGAAPLVRLPADSPMSAWWTAAREAITDAGTVALCVPDPDRGPEAGSDTAVGERRVDAHGVFVYRPWRTWIDLAEALGGRTSTPTVAEDGTVTFRIDRLSTPATPPDTSGAPFPADPYGAGGAFGRFHKLEDAATFTSLVTALGRTGLVPGARVLVLGAHRGDEIDALLLASAQPIEAFDVVAVEQGRSISDVGRSRHPQVRWICGDVAELERWDLGRFDLVLAIGLLQSPAVDRQALLRTIVKGCVAQHGAVVLGLPNSRMVAGDLLWGARTMNVGPVEMGLVVRDAAAIRRTLQRHRFRVFVTGKYDLLLTGVR